MDITTDGFGFMLSVGDLAWVPFVYSLQPRYLVFKPMELGPVYTAAIVGVNLTGYYIFRVANGEKNDFRNGRNPKSKHCIIPIVCGNFIVGFIDLQYMTTERGSKLLTSGWWGMSRHPNYLYVHHYLVARVTSLTAIPQRRSHHGFGVVATHRVRHAHHVLLCHVLHGAVDTPPKS